jgi:PKD repeat protein
MSGAFEMKLLSLCGRPNRLPPVTPQPGWSTRKTPDALGSSNVMVNSPTQDTGGHTTHSETSTVAVGSVICTSFNDAGEGFGANGFSGFSFSLDGGQTFTDGGPFPNGASGDSNRGDPSLAFSVRDSTYYYAALSTNGLSLWRSTNSCQTFQYVGVIHSGASDDKELIAVDNTPTSPHFGRIYIGWTNFGVATNLNETAFSDNGGTTWSSPATLPNSGIDGQGMWPAVAPNGDVYFALLNEAPSVGGLQNQWIYKSTDGATTWTQMTNIATGQLRPENPTASSSCGREAITGNIRLLPSPQIAISPDATAAAGYVINAVYSYDSDGTGPDVSNVFYRRSTDGAQTWSPEVKLNDDATTTDQWFPALGLSETGILVVSWYDRRLDPTNNLQFDRFMSFSVDGGHTWSPNQRVSDVTSPVAQTLPNFDGLAACYHGDYDQLAVTGSTAHIVWSDDRRVVSAHPNPDVYYNRVVLGSSLAVSPAIFEGGNSATGTLFLSAPAPAGGTTATLVSSAPAVVTVPASVVVAAGSTSGTFSVTSVPTTTQTSVTITATLPDGTTPSTTISVLASPTPTSLTLSPTTVTGGQTSTGTVTLSTPAPAAGSVVTLSSTPTTVATVPATLSIPAGAQSGTFTVTSLAQPANTSATISASLNGLTQSATLQVTPPPGNATFDTTFLAPRCASPGPLCDTGPTLVRGRDNIVNGAEPNTPNTIAGSCVDGTSGTFHVDESVDRLLITTLDGTPLAPGKPVNVNVTVWVFDSLDALDVFFAPDATNPVWTLEATIPVTGSAQLETLTAAFTLPASSLTTLPAVRAQWRFGGSAVACSTGSFNDRDDLIFTYQADTTPPTVTITSPANNTPERGVVTVVFTATDNVGVASVALLIDGHELPFADPLHNGGGLFGPLARPATLAEPKGTALTDTVFSLPVDTTTLTTGPHTITATATDAAGNQGQSAPVTIIVDNVAPTVAVTAPAPGASVSGSVPFTASAADVGTGVAAVDFLVDGALLTTVATPPYSTTWNTATAIPGSHTLTARATDLAGNQTVSAAVTVTVVSPPVVSAGPNVTITLPATATLNGSVTPSTATVQWSTTSGPGTVTFASPTSPVTTASFSTAGTYVVRLTATSAGLSAFAEATITVNPAIPPPVVSAGPDLTITLPATATLNGSVNPTTSTVQWSTTSGPGTVTFASPTSPVTTASFSTAGTYVVRLTATDAGGSAFAEATITVNPAIPPPVVSAGPNLTITLPATATLNGSVTPTTSTVQWSTTSGPGTVTFASPTSPVTTASFSTAGTYVVRLTATDAGGTAFAEATITVNAAATNPCANLCSNPTNFTINGSFQSGNIGTGAVCLQTTSVIHGGNCGNFVSPRKLTVNGTQEVCNSGNWASVPAARNGGYCIQTTSGNQPWAFITAW